MNKVTPLDCEQSAFNIINYPNIPEIGITPLNQNINICKICLEEQATDLSLLVRMNQSEVRDMRLMVPCQCSGSVGYVHQKCIKTWIQKQFQNTGRRNIYCQICKSQIFFKLKKIKYCECKLQNLSLISGCNILTVITEIVLLFVAILILRYSINFSDSDLFRYVMIVFICILGIAFLFTMVLIIRQAFIRSKRYISRIFTLEQSEQLGLRQVRAKSANHLPDKSEIKSKSKSNQVANTFYIPNNARPSQMAFLSIIPANLAENI